MSATAQNVRAVTRALTILKSFSGRHVQSLAEVTLATGLDKGTTRRLLLTLMHSGFVTQDAGTLQYRLGRAVRELASDVGRDIDLKGLAQPILVDLAADLHMTVFLSVYHDGEALCLDRLHDMKGIEVHWWAVGGTLPHNCGGAPKLLLAFQPPDEIESALAKEKVALTPKSILAQDELRKRLQLIRRRGWEMAVDDVTLGLTALAIPVRDEAGDIVCSISLAGLTPQMVDRGRPVHLARLQEAGRALEAALAVGRSRR
jgi:IclR family transcriptional regulator, KDG regulon repressor